MLKACDSEMGVLTCIGAAVDDTSRMDKGLAPDPEFGHGRG
jgi:hypothetical protein